MINFIRMGILSIAVALPMGVAAETEQVNKPPCQCRDRDGERRDLGSVDCFDISGKRALFRCEMSTNTPYWKRIEDQGGCPLARKRMPWDPARVVASTASSGIL